MASSLRKNTSFGADHDLVMEGWEIKENKDGVIYFVNNIQKVTSWIHPYLNKLFEELSNYSNVKYAAYRTALKLRLLQVELGFSWITSASVQTVFSKIPLNEDCSDDYLSCRAVFRIIHEIIETSDSLHLHLNHITKASEMMLNLMLELYDNSRSGRLLRRSIKTALIALCSAKLSDKYRLFFDAITCSKGLIQREKFIYLISDLMQITELLKESTAFGTNVSAAVNSCLNSDTIISSKESSQDMFFTWLLHEPQTLIWLPTLHRIVATENIQHNVQCCVCNTFPIVGFRYRCLQCLKYDSCQSCFFLGRFSQSHRLKHPMQEYCLPTTTRDNTKALLKIVRNKISRRHRQSKVKYLPIDDDSITGSVIQWQPRGLVPVPRDSFCSSTDSGLAVGIAQEDLQSVESASDMEEIAAIKQWIKPVEVLGEPCDTSSPCLQGENPSKKLMENQQQKMSEMILQLQEENRILKQRLAALGESEEVEEEQCHVIEHTVIADVESKNLSSDPFKEITTDEPISPIKLSNTHHETADKDSVINERDTSVNVLDLVGSCTPIPSSFCSDNKDSTDSNESGINEDHANSDKSSLQRVSVEQEECCQTPAEEEIAMEKFAPIRNPQIVALQALTDTETESTTSNDLEYTYSDMSLKSEFSSRAASIRSGEVRFPLENLSDPELLAKNRTLYCHGEDSSDHSDSSSSYSIPLANTSSKRNDTLDLDAFRLCRMKFDKSAQLAQKGRRSDSACSEPQLIYSSSSKNKRESRSCRSDSPRTANSIASKNVDHNTLVHSYTTDCTSFNLSEIPLQASRSSFAHEGPRKSSQPDNSSERRKKPEPVFMSTPVTNQIGFIPTSKALSNKKSSSARLPRRREEKENWSPLYRGSSSKEVYHSSKAQAALGMTPRSSIPHWQRQRILQSAGRFQANKSFSCNDLTANDGEVGMSTMFDRAEQHRTIGDGMNSLPLADKEELERMIEKVGIEDSDLSPCPDKSNSSMLQAVLDIGDAMADFVQAAADTQRAKESTRL